MCEWEIDLTGIEEVYKGQVINGIDTVLQDFSFLKDIPIKICIHDIKSTNPATMKVEHNKKYYYTIYLSEYYFNYQYGLSKLKDIMDDRFYSNFSSVLIHEFGHILQELYCIKIMLHSGLIKSEIMYYENIRNSLYEKIFLWFLKIKCYYKNRICMFKHHGYLGYNAAKNIYEFFADCFNTYYYLKDEDTITRVNTREYKAFKISEYVLSEMKEVLNNNQK